jgi:CDP-diacylglycerol--glycerol-3-phosphate 3-phosphatidyltransferase
LAWIPALLYTLAAIADGVDGYLARRTNQATRLGEILDIEFDALGILVATTLAVQYQQLPAWYLALGLARYFFTWGIWWRTRQGNPVYHLPYSATRRIIAGFHMGFSTVMLWPIVYPPGTTLAGIVLAVPFLTGFIRDWLIVSGRINPTSPAYLAIKQKFTFILTHQLPVLLRGLITVATINLIIPVLKNSIAPATLFIWIPLPFPELTAWVIMVIAIIATSMLVLGIAGRTAALALVIVASANIFSTGLYLNNGLMLSSIIAVMLVGTGAFSRWQPEDALLYRQAG